MKLFLFDIDGTLLTVNGAGRAAKSLAMREVFGTEGDVNNKPFGGKTDWQILSEALENYGFTPEMVGARMEEYQRIFAARLYDVIDQYRADVMPGAYELVADLRRRPDVVLGIVTGNTAATAPIKLRVAGFDPDWFPASAYGSEAYSRNDLPRLALERAIALCGQLITPADVIVIGDTVADIHCARALGAQVVAVRTGFEETALLAAAAPDVLLDDLTQFWDYVHA